MKINYILRLFNLIFSGALVLGLSIWGWDCWASYERSDRTVRVTELSSQMFIAMSNLRIDRVGTAREFSDQGHPIGKTLANARAAELPALAAVIEILQGIDLPDRTKYIDGLTASLKRLKELHAETASAIIRPKSEVRPNLIAESEEQCKSILDSLVQLSSASERLIKLDNAMVDQMLDLYKLAWDTRNMAGDVGALISKSFVGAPLVPDAKAKQMFAFAQIDTYWRILTEKSSYLHLPQRFYDSIADVNKLYFDGPYRPLQVQVLGELTAGQKPSVSVEKWNETAAAALAPMVTTASTALDIANEQASQTRNAMFLQLIVALCSLAAAAVFTLVANVYVTRRVTKPITAMTTAMTRLAAGDADQDLPGVGRSDEIGGMAAAVNVFRENLIRNRELEQENIQSRVDEEQKRKVMLYDLAAKFEASVGGIVRAVANSAGDLEQAATVMSRTALDTSKRSTVVAAASEEAATNVTVVASAAEELGSSVTEIGRQVTRSASIAQGAADEARSTAEIVAELSTSAANISEVLGLISTIAAQTNLLALNATIEAARAGEAGRGFAVVAAEVKELANQTAKATADISGQIGAIQSATERAVVAIGGIGETIEQINRDATAITDAVTEQGKATSEIVGSIAQASRGTSEVTDNIASVASAATECGTAADQVLSASRHLKGQSEQLRSEVDRFLGTVRAA